MEKIITDIEKLIAKRKSAPVATSYVASLFAGGSEKIGRKVCEEATETLIAALKETKKRQVSEAADLIFHLLVLLSYNKIKFSEVAQELEKRLGISGLDEKAARTAKKKRK
ncbi:MAG TPA: phosphoribosyl-ATP diphosphatase [Alphaproteobacteria bacterium]|nr:phosphoribosyl-ATP diphosphatase [Alphaproteobacteria bacterium]